ncbi:ECs_2282 family putative zinc-binding protein [Burkholderia gladioli]|uniref:ECs_2282 family putative zinc-binding protein n=1 Tax=Burkholderia gladioli TaxID=28095 RepID=UPI003A5C21B6
MTVQNLGTATIRCPQCGGTQFIDHRADGAENQDPVATCARCGKQLSAAELDVITAKIGEAFSNSVADALRDALKKLR